ncbi:MAG: type II toxin-antitoxin system VapC family toxin [Parvibaculaceae bacterium]
MSTLVDSNVILDLVSAGEWTGWSKAKLQTHASEGQIVLNPVIYAEASSKFVFQGDFESMIRHAGFMREDCPWDAAYIAGQAHLLYRRRGGTRERTLPDFLIGAHALVKGHTLLTRDARRYREYFPNLDIIAPDTHP